MRDLTFDVQSSAHFVQFEKIYHVVGVFNGTLNLLNLLVRLHLVTFSLILSKTLIQGVTKILILLVNGQFDPENTLCWKTNAEL